MTITTDPNSADLRKVKADGQQEAYLVLSDEERAKGFVRPVRRSYKHITCGGITTMGQAIAETYARDPHFYGGTFCAPCGQHSMLRDSEGRAAFLWDRDNTEVGG